MERLELIWIAHVLPKLHPFGIHNWFIDYLDDPYTEFCAQCGLERPV